VRTGNLDFQIKDSKESRTKRVSHDIGSITWHRQQVLYISLVF